MPNPLYGNPDKETFVPRTDDDYRSPFRRDVARLVHSPGFRRLQGKTQLFSGLESDFFRNRLTHSMEVAQIAKSLAIKLNQDEKLLDLGWQIDLDLVEFAGLAHDLGHPPFGHTGEHVLHRLMASHGGFEGNAQTLRLLSRLEKKIDDAEQLDFDATLKMYDEKTGADVALGLNLTARTLASVLKYDEEIPPHGDPGVVTKGYYASEAAVVDFAKRQILGPKSGKKRLKTIECQIMDLADDIAYSTYDIEDSFKAGISTPLHLMSTAQEVGPEVALRVNKELSKEGLTVSLEPSDIFKTLDYSVFPHLKELDPTGAHHRSRALAGQGHFRSSVTSWLVRAAIEAVEFIPNKKHPALSQIKMQETARIRVSVLKHLTYTLVIESSQLKLVSHRGAQIVETIFETFHRKPDLLPPDFELRWKRAPKSKKKRVIADFVAGMTDRYAVELYARLTSEDFRSMFQPT